MKLNGWGQKIFRGAQINFFLKFWSEDQKEIKKKVFIPDNAQWIRAICILSWHNSRSRGYVHSLAGRNGIFWCGSRFLPTNSVVKTKKKGLWPEILGLVLALTCVFRPGTRLYSRLEGGHKQWLRGTASKCPPWRRACVEHALEYVIATYLMQARKHQFLNTRFTFLSKLDEIIAGAWINYHFYKIPNIL